jgi:hypothetical protein
MARNRWVDRAVDGIDYLQGMLVDRPGFRRTGKYILSEVAERTVPPVMQLAALRATHACRRALATADVFQYPFPPTPFTIRWIDPTVVQRFSARIHPSWWGRRRLFGAVRDGDWDRRLYSTAPHHPAYPNRGERSLLYADRIEEAPLYKAICTRIRDGTAWTDTMFVERVIERVESGTSFWHACRTRAEVLERCARLDRLYATIQQDGFRPQRDLIAAETVFRAGILHALAHEIVVDVGRNGEFLLVSGKHRLSIARAAGIKSVPVAVCVRHERWMRERTMRAETSERHSHSPANR